MTESYDLIMIGSGPGGASLAQRLGKDLPHPEDRVYHKDGKVHLDLTATNPRALARLKRNQAGTCRFGSVR